VILVFLYSDVVQCCLTVLASLCEFAQFANVFFLKSNDFSLLCVFFAVQTVQFIV